VMRAHLQKTAVVLRSLPTKTASTAVFMLSYMPRVQAPLNQANARSWASNTISCVSRG
jgi:hypothetical protein